MCLVLLTLWLLAQQRNYFRKFKGEKCQADETQQSEGNFQSGHDRHVPSILSTDLLRVPSLQKDQNPRFLPRVLQPMELLFFLHNEQLPAQHHDPQTFPRYLEHELRPLHPPRRLALLRLPLLPLQTLHQKIRKIAINQ